MMPQRSFPKSDVRLAGEMHNSGQVQFTCNRCPNSNAKAQNQLSTAAS